VSPAHNFGGLGVERYATALEDFTKPDYSRKQRCLDRRAPIFTNGRSIVACGRSASPDGSRRMRRAGEDMTSTPTSSSPMPSSARLLLLLANFGKEGRPEPIVGNFSQETLAEMIGTTRSRVSFFMNKFRKLGFIDYTENWKSIIPC
jgi:hypothetical protein